MSDRRRKFTQNKAESSSLEPQASDKEVKSLLQRLIDWDVDRTKCMAVCATSDSEWGTFRPLMRFLEYSAHGVPWLLGNAFAILATHHILMHEKLLNLFYALLLDLIVITVMKAVVRRRRPAHNVKGDMLTVSVDLYSFPSGHASRAITMACFFCDHFCSSFLTQTAMAIWGVCVSVSRILLGRHHVIDVLCGMVVGVVQYLLLVEYLWLDAGRCADIIRPIQEELHL